MMFHESLGRRGLAAATSLALPGLAKPTPALAQGSALRGREGFLFLQWDNPAQAAITNVPRVAASFVEAANLLRAAGVETCIAVIPSKFRIYRDMLLPDQPFSAGAEQRLEVSLAELRKGPSLVPDLGALLLNHRRAHPDQQLFFRADTHWTPLAAAIAAQEIARLIRASNMLPPSRVPGVRLGPAITQNRTRRDLLEFVPAADRPAYPVEPYLIRPILPARGGLLEAPVSDVTVLGSSFVAQEFNFHGELSAALDRPVALEWKVQTVGPFRILLDYLASPLFRRERPRMLVITILESAMSLGPENRGAYPSHFMSGADFLRDLRLALAAPAPR